LLPPRSVVTGARDRTSRPSRELKGMSNGTVSRRRP